MLSRHLFDTLGAQEPVGLGPYEGAHSTMANRSCIAFYDIITLLGRVHDYVINETFIIGYLRKVVILGMPFLERHQCHMDFQKSAVVMTEKELACGDTFCRPLVNQVQVLWTA